MGADRSVTATPDRYFDQLWGDSDDPWDHAGRFYEHRKYDLTAAVLPRSRYARAFEPGCGVGLLTQRLAGRADHLEATDRHPAAVRATRQRCRDHPNVTVSLSPLPDVPASPFDLVVLSEVLYYFDTKQIADILREVSRVASDDAHLVAVHYRLPVAEHAASGDDVHALLGQAAGWSRAVSHVEDEFLLDVFERR